MKYSREKFRYKKKISFWNLGLTLTDLGLYSLLSGISWETTGNMAALRRARWGLSGKVVGPQSANSSKGQPYAKVLTSVHLNGCGSSNQGFLGGTLLADHFVASSCGLPRPRACDFTVSSVFYAEHRSWQNTSFKQLFDFDTMCMLGKNESRGPKCQNYFPAVSENYFSFLFHDYFPCSWFRRKVRQ